mgnify:CR=1 FL=1
MNAIQEIKDAYTLEDFEEIVNHGCQSGVCSQHVYYADTIKFFDKYEDEIIEYIADTYGGELNEQIWHSNSCNVMGYKNDTVWQFIESIADIAVYEHYESKSNTVPIGVNQPGTMTMERYSSQ